MLSNRLCWWCDRKTRLQPTFLRRGLVERENCRRGAAVLTNEYRGAPREALDHHFSGHSLRDFVSDGVGKSRMGDRLSGDVRYRQRT